VRDPSQNRGLIVRIRHSFDYAEPVKFPLPFLIEFALAFRHCALVRSGIAVATGARASESGFTVKTPLSIRIVKLTDEAVIILEYWTS